MSDRHSKERKDEMAGRHNGAIESPGDSTMQVGALREPGPEAILAEPPDARDIAAELAAPPRRKLPWLRLLLVAGTVAGLGFAGGAYYQKSSGTTAGSGTPTGFSRPSGGGAGGFGAGGAGGAGGGGAGGAGGAGGSSSGSTSGTVKLVDGDTVYLTTSSGAVVKVTTGGSTKVSTTTSGKAADLVPGRTVTVEGTTDSAGNVAATTVTEGG
jgi:hypothetical protein